MYTGVIQTRFTFVSRQSGGCVRRHVKLARKLEIIVELYSHLPRGMARNKSINNVYANAPLPVIVESLELDDQHFGKLFDTHPLHSVNLAWQHGSRGWGVKVNRRGNDNSPLNTGKGQQLYKTTYRSEKEGK